MLDEMTARQGELNDLARAFQRLRTFVEELRRATRGKPFDIRSMLVWDSLHALHRILIIDLAAWVDSLHAAWFRRHLQGASLAMLRNSKTLAAKIVDGSPRRSTDRWVRQHRASLTLQGRQAALVRLFGKKTAERGRASAEDIIRLEKRLYRWSKNLREWRNVQAHRYGTEIGSATPLRMQDLARRFVYCGRLMNDLRLLIDSSTYSMPSIEPSKHDLHARDLVDLMVVGTIQDAVEAWQADGAGTYLWQKRDRHYDRMHRRRRAGRTDSFNARTEDEDDPDASP